MSVPIDPIDDSKVDFKELPGPSGQEEFKSRTQQEKYLGGGGGQTEKTNTKMPQETYVQADNANKEWIDLVSDTDEQEKELREAYERGKSFLDDTEGNDSSHNKTAETKEKAQIRDIRHKLAQETNGVTPLKDKPRSKEASWDKEPFNAALNSALSVINERILGKEGAEPITAEDIINNPDFTFTADFKEQTNEIHSSEKWRLIIDRKKDHKGVLAPRVAIRNLNGKVGDRFESTIKDHEGKYVTLYSNGCDVMEGNNINMYMTNKNKTFFGYGWDKNSSFYYDDEVKSQMTESFNNCLTKLDKVKMKKWKSPQINERIKQAKQNSSSEAKT
jgi:hypothetical protein